MAAGMWGRAVPPDRDPGTLRAALMTMSAVAWAARWAASGRTLNGTVRYWNPLSALAWGVDLGHEKPGPLVTALLDFPVRCKPSDERIPHQAGPPLRLPRSQS